MIGRGNGKPGSRREPGFRHVRVSPAQKAAIEKSQCYYFELTCGHFIAREVREIYRVFSAIEIFCEICNQWMPPKEHVTITNYPDIPLF